MLTRWHLPHQEAFMLKSLLPFSAATLFAVALAALLCATPQQTAAAQANGTNPVKLTPDVLAKAKAIYQVDCAMCHGDKGDGKTDLATGMSLTMPDWTNPATLASKSDKDLFDVIRAGKDKMPPEDAGRAKDPDVWGLILYIRGLSKGSAAATAK
jgi:mono/diheme cytochrome c family protein